MTKTTKKHFGIFKTECERLIKKAGLGGWSVKIFHRKCETENATAEIEYGMINRSVIIVFDTEWDENYRILTPEAVRVTAKHEIAHLIIARLAVSAEARFITESEVTEAKEEIARILEKIL